MGGNQVDFVTEIKHDSIPKTVDFIKESILKPSNINDFQVLGSQGKKEYSGDIDIGIDIKNNLHNDLTPKEQVETSYNKIQENVVKLFNYKTFDTQTLKQVENKRMINQMKGLGIISVSFPQINKDGTFSKDFVQLDLIFGNLEFMKDYTNTLHFADFAEDIDKINVNDVENIETTDFKNVYKNGILISQLDEFTKRENSDGTISKVLISYNGFKYVRKKGKKKVEEKFLDISFLDLFRKIFKDGSLSQFDLVSVENLVQYLKQNPYTNEHYESIIEKFKGFCKGLNLEVPQVV